MKNLFSAQDTLIQAIFPKISPKLAPGKLHRGILEVGGDEKIFCGNLGVLPPDKFFNKIILGGSQYDRNFNKIEKVLNGTVRSWLGRYRTVQGWVGLYSGGVGVYRSERTFA